MNAAALSGLKVVELGELMGNPDWAGMDIFQDVFARAENWNVLEPMITG